MRKRRAVGRIYGMKYSWKGHIDRNRHKHKKKVRASSVGLCQKHKPQRPYHVNVSPCGPQNKAFWKLTHGTMSVSHVQNIHFLLKKNPKKPITFLQRTGVLVRLPASPKYGESTAVKHILIECADLLEIRKKYFEERCIHSFGTWFRNFFFFNFFREIGVFYKIWSVLRKCLCEVFSKSCLKILCGTFYNLFNK